MDRAVDKDATTKLGICNKKSRGIQLVAGLGAEDRGRTDVAVRQAAVGITIRGVEAARETTDDFLGREFLDGLLIGSDDGLGLLLSASSQRKREKKANREFIGHVQFPGWC